MTKTLISLLLIAATVATLAVLPFTLTAWLADAGPIPFVVNCFTSSAGILWLMRDVKYIKGGKNV